MSLQSVFHRPLRAVVVGLWLTGALIAGFTAPLAAARLSPLASLALALPALGLALLAVATFRGVGWALVLSLVLLGAQVVGVVGSAWELSHRVDASKASEFHALGFDPTFAVGLKLLYSAVAAGLFGWTVFRILMQRPVTI
jgi:hypothetical protein